MDLTILQITIKVDGKYKEMENYKVTFDENGNMELSLIPLFIPGGHTLLIEQKTDKGMVREAITYYSA